MAEKGPFSANFSFMSSCSIHPSFIYESGCLNKFWMKTFLDKNSKWTKIGFLEKCDELEMDEMNMKSWMKYS